MGTEKRNKISVRMKTLELVHICAIRKTRGDKLYSIQAWREKRSRTCRNGSWLSG